MTTAAMGNRYSKRSKRRQRCRNIRSRIALAMAIYGRRVTGAMLRKATTGFRARGPGRLKWDSCGRRDIGDLSAAGIAITMGFGVGISATTAGLITDSATSESDTKAGTGTAIGSKKTKSEEQHSH